ncbi:MAG: Sigma 54 modulation protein/ribosomal protein S30EA [Parcubacteria group bacterium Gr01-1014_70]|nr:MAG: Sigma 54 modulation protein/ribosomal protein S30EA [Parcubacteria group bacterium Gr01-1014_70]
MISTYNSKNIAFSDAMKVYIEDKITKRLENLFGDADTSGVQLVVEVGKDSKHHRKGLVWEAEATVSMGSVTLRAESRGESFEESVDLLENEITREVKKLKGKQGAVTRRGARRAKKNATIARSARFYRKGRIREEGR